jgi:hypothetical protein
MSDKDWPKDWPEEAKTGLGFLQELLRRFPKQVTVVQNEQQLEDFFSEEQKSAHSD